MIDLPKVYLTSEGFFSFGMVKIRMIIK